VLWLSRGAVQQRKGVFHHVRVVFGHCVDRWEQESVDEELDLGLGEELGEKVRDVFVRVTVCTERSEVDF